ncbi:hypothetical protein BJX68DRAFT_260644 [Aspergillus pseudodeflectus]|uniref:Uncharacterized protein n=1 Tax=Aspergillus pseudodeflectus TaxID=176178 RepID=A0ABR4LBK6_9EURO
MKVVPHKDGTCLVAYARHEDHDYLGEPNLYKVNARDVHEFLLWAVGVENPEEEGGEVYPQIVKYLGRLKPGFKLEYLCPGPWKQRAPQSSMSPS